ncbi:MAG: hypothetical protein GVY22_16280 [Gammaproteobacteria bacterium]|jgi:peptidyl-prolyl cis-trans isomerase C|nr:hypothetical protein [Gammaproteobacteria bacterium]
MRRYLASSLASAAVAIVFSAGFAASPVYASQLLVTNGGVSVTSDDVEAERVARSGPPQLSMSLNASRQPAAAIVNQLYRRKMLADYARERNLENAPWVQARLHRAREEVLANVAVESKRAELLGQIPDVSKRAFELYQADPESFSLPTRVRVAHILLSPTPERCGEDLEAEVANLRDRILAGEAFTELAKAVSDDSATAKEDGELPWFGRGEMVPAFEKAAFALKNPGDLSAPVTTQYGVHLIQLLERQEGRQQSFDEVKPGLISRLKQEWIKAEMASWRSELLDPSKATVNEAALEAYLKSNGEAASRP